MSELNVAAELFAVGFLAFGGVALGLAALSRRPWWARGLAGGYLVVAAAAAAARLPNGWWAPPLVLGGAYLLLAVARRFRDAIAGLLAARRIHAALLLTAGPLLAAGWVYRFEQCLCEPIVNFSEIAALRHPSPPEPAGYVAHTNRGATIALYRAIADDDIGEMEKQFDAQLETTLPLKLIQTAAADPTCNCHGWVFAGGRFYVRGSDVPTILTDDEYTEVSQPQPGDVIVYRDGAGNAVHTGLVRLAEGDLILVESKWGPLGRFLHAPIHQPYSTTWAFYRGPRDDHTLSIEAGE